MLENLKRFVKTVELQCTNCHTKIKEGDLFTANIILPSEKCMLVGPLDKTIAKTAESVLCSKCRN